MKGPMGWISGEKWQKEVLLPLLIPAFEPVWAKPFWPNQPPSHWSPSSRGCNKVFWGMCHISIIQQFSSSCFCFLLVHLCSSESSRHVRSQLVGLRHICSPWQLLLELATSGRWDAGLRAPTAQKHETLPFYVIHLMPNQSSEEKF